MFTSTTFLCYLLEYYDGNAAERRKAVLFHPFSFFHIQPQKENRNFFFCSWSVFALSLFVKKKRESTPRTFDFPATRRALSAVDWILANSEAMAAALPVPVPATPLAASVLAAMPPNSAVNALVTCGRTRKRTRALEAVVSATPGPSDSQDIGAMMMAENAAVAAAGGVGAGAPAWAAPLLAGVAALQLSMAAVLLSVHNLEARQRNQLARDPTDAIEPIWVAVAGGAPGVPAAVASPVTVAQCDAMSGPQARSFLHAYGVPAGGTAVEARARVRRFLGMMR